MTCASALAHQQIWSNTRSHRVPPDSKQRSEMNIMLYRQKALHHETALVNHGCMQAPR